MELLIIFNNNNILNLKKTYFQWIILVHGFNDYYIIYNI